MGDILFLAHRIPYPPDRGDKMRGFHILKHLSRRHRVHLIAFADDQRDLAHQAVLSGHVASCQVIWRGKHNIVAALQSLATHRAASISAFDNREMAATVAKALKTRPIDTIYVFSSQMAQYLPAKPRQRVLMDFVDVDSAKFEAYAGQARWPMRWMHAREARLLGGYERAVARRVDAGLFVSEAEAALFRSRARGGNIQVLENGIDTDFYDPKAAMERISGMGPLLTFTGQMNYRPNVEAVKWFADRVMPRIREHHPRARFAVVGRRPADAVVALASREDVLVTGEVADVRGWLAAASVAVAPLRLARGIQNKVLEAMAMARPVVASAAAAEGVDDAGTIRVADGEAAMASAICALLADREAAEALGASARERVLARYGWAARLAPLDVLLGDAARDRKSAA
ncbi:TIGR03087 family PEP-CTERM/XrtA system glycosyltransferase [Stakelama marina]|uniref:TIGR03087 family PEP-CTERM/XrtA system glycosyltransferase n=1 Tax=Stakelama marina TaxID=2826939 RepID=A0A8T4II04_9SPHN|nr:TIGR03087 family PEP-CTERM/XrtA system glycosyltransferase [Stakelama marina]MBR0551929.1 TIGR03087 family PEP-CTERM/XrtA system glycosyltransferase [Stakelama marina]